MKFTKNWLLDYLEPNCSFNDILNGLLNLGLEVENIIDYTSKLKDFTVAEIVEAKKHENAQKLQICTVNTLYGLKQIVCGAPNARVGIKVIFANIGIYIPGTGITLKDVEIRGVKSSGMLLSEMELGISNKHSSIIEISDEFSIGDSASFALGLNDSVIEVAVTPNLGHLLSVKNIAKALANLGLGIFKEKNYSSLIDIQNTKQTNNNKFINLVSKNLQATINTDICPAAVIVQLKNLDNTVCTPQTIANRLKLIGQELINPISDIINYVTIDINHPFLAYTYSALQHTDISIDFGNAEDKILLSNNKEYTNLSEIALVKIQNKPVGIAGMIESEPTRVHNNSKDIILECAYFYPDIVAKSSKYLCMNTNVSYHFKRGVNALDLLDATNIALNLITETCGGEIKDNIFFNNTTKYKTVETTFTYINDILGVEISKELIINYLTKQGFKVTYNEDDLNIKVPSYRNDIELECDIAGSILNFYGINNIKETNINNQPAILNNNLAINQSCNNIENNLVSNNNSYKTTLLVKKILSTFGLLENINMSFISRDIAELFEIYKPSLELSNPISNDLVVMRQSLIPSLTKAVYNNLRQGYGDLKFFEVSNVFHDLNTITTNVATILSGYKHKKDWRNSNQLYDIFDSKEILFNLIKTLGLDPNKFRVSKDNLPSYLHCGKSAILLLGTKPLAYFGELHPKVIKYFNLKHTPVVFELFLNILPIVKHKNTVKIQEFSKQMPLERSFAFIVNKNIQTIDIINTVFSVNKKLISDVRIFDVYNCSDSKKSIGFSVTINSKHTLNDLEINNLSNSIITAVTNKTGGILRDK